MEIEYSRSIGSSNMLIRYGGKMEQVEEAMLIRNQIYGVVPLKFQREDEKLIFYYNITGMQAFDILLESNNTDEQLLLLLLSGIGGLLERLDKYLICQHHILLQPECIFWDYKAEEFRFCYYPGNELELQDAFRKLMEFLLTKTDHKDERAVEIAYEVYETTLKSGYSLTHIRESLHLWQQKNASKTAEVEEDNIRLTKRQESVTGAGEIATEQKKAARVKFAQGYLKVTDWKNKVKDFWKEKIRFYLPSVFMGSKEVMPIVFEPEREEPKISRPTVLLAEKVKQPLGILKYEGANHRQDLELGNVPYVIGSDSSCDGQIDSSTVSRKHAKITKTENIYFVEDLNSLNGTVVGGELLRYKTRRSLERNEVIEFAGEKYRFL